MSRGRNGASGGALWGLGGEANVHRSAAKCSAWLTSEDREGTRHTQQDFCCHTKTPDLVL